MSSCCFLTLAKHELDSNPQSVSGPWVELFTPADHATSDDENDAAYAYQISVGCLKRRLETLGFTLDNCREALERLKSDMIRQLDEFAQYRRSGPPTPGDAVDVERRYLQQTTVEGVLELLRSRLNEERLVPFDASYDEAPPAPRIILLRAIFGGAYENEPLQFHWFNAYRLLAELLPEDCLFRLDYTDLVSAGYYQPHEQPIDHGFDLEVQNRHPESFILGQALSDEGVGVEYKEVSSKSPVQKINGNLTKYAIGFLNAGGGRILFGVDDRGRVSGLKLDYSSRDQLRQHLVAVINTIEPAIACDAISIKFREVVYDGAVVPDQFVVEYTVPAGEPNEMYFGPRGKTWVRLDGATKSLEGYALFAHIRGRHVLKGRAV